MTFVWPAQTGRRWQPCGFARANGFSTLFSEWFLYHDEFGERIFKLTDLLWEAGHQRPDVWAEVVS